MSVLQLYFIGLATLVLQYKKVDLIKIQYNYCDKVLFINTQYSI